MTDEYLNGCMLLDLENCGMNILKIKYNGISWYYPI